MGMDTVELVMSVEDNFSMKIPDEVAATFNTVGMLYEYTLKNHGLNSNPTSEEVWSAIVNITVNQLGVTAEEVKKESRFVDDLGAD